MRMEALLLSALILAPTAGATAVQAVPAQDFRVSYAQVARKTTPSIFTKTELPQELTDAEMDAAKGEFVALVATAARACAASTGCLKVVGTAAGSFASGFLMEYVQVKVADWLP
ncbi:hypothetical protein CBQ26_12080 [Deinococcus indicus]|uniref:Uncharacterized protein n=2 Tax=Deinococcus indicus TaxID=223556 RepID=A0A246BJN7_9DEIO|nr:hypothetical protein CBQ26_12080 [Deinococcus indicus]